MVGCVYHYCFISSEPNASPLNLRPVDTTLTSIFVTWDEVPASDQNGIILTYTVRYHKFGEDGVNASINSTTKDFPTQQANLTGLQNDTRYNISVLASTIKGDGPYSQPIFVSSNQDSKLKLPLSYNYETRIIFNPKIIRNLRALELFRFVGEPEKSRSRDYTFTFTRSYFERVFNC